MDTANEQSSSRQSGPPQIFKVTAIQDESRADVVLQLQSLSCQPEYLNWSPEELRAQALGCYLVQKSAETKTIPQSVPSTVTSPLPSSILPTEVYQSISADPLYSDHSHEEIRWAFKHTQEDLPSSRLFHFNAPQLRETEPREDSVWRANLYTISSSLPTLRFWELEGAEMHAKRIIASSSLP